ncbi:MAG: TIGR00153 family protein [Candidatus Natronoplasma sp.]
MAKKLEISNPEEALIDSPFEGLKKHSALIKKAIDELMRGVKLYMEGRFEEAQKSFEKVAELEHRADKIKIEIRENLPRFIFLPVTRDEFLRLLKEADSILDHAEDVSLFLPMREEEIPDEIEEDFEEFSKKIFGSVKQVDELMSVFVGILKSSFGGKSKEKVRELQLQIAKKEYEADKIERKISKELFNHDEDPLKAIHLLKVVDKMDSIADHAENVGDMIDSTVVSK